jgi:DNA-binding XRE family transcriptional regulator
MPTKTWDSIKRKKMSEERIVRIRNSAHNEVIALTLRELREEAGLTQVEVSKLVDMTQSALSRLERREDNPIPALRQYIEALGGELELVAILGRKRIRLVGV